MGADVPAKTSSPWEHGSWDQSCVVLIHPSAAGETLALVGKDVHCRCLPSPWCNEVDGGIRQFLSCSGEQFCLK